MTQQEKDIVDQLGDVWNKFLALEQLHPSDNMEFQTHIHALQNIVFAREGFRQYKGVYTPTITVKGSDLVSILNRTNRKR